MRRPRFPSLPLPPLLVLAGGTACLSRAAVLGLRHSGNESRGSFPERLFQGSWPGADPPRVGRPYAPAAGQAGSTAIHRTDPRFKAWAGRVLTIKLAPTACPSGRTPAKALGPADDDPASITCLGAGGSITLAFPAYIKNGPGADFAVFENSFLDDYIEHAWVEVSRDGSISSASRITRLNRLVRSAPSTVMDPTDVQGLGCKYRQPYGEPYDLAEVGLDSVSHVRLVDVMGDGTARDSANRIIHDPFPNAQSAGFDLDAIGVIHLATWQTLTVGRSTPTGSTPRPSPICRMGASCWERRASQRADRLGPAGAQPPLAIAAWSSIPPS